MAKHPPWCQIKAPIAFLQQAPLASTRTGPTCKGHTPPICIIPHPAIASTESLTDGSRTKASDLSLQTKVATTSSSTNLQFVVKIILRPNKPGYHIRKSLSPKSKNSRSPQSVSSLRVKPRLICANLPGLILAPLHVRAAPLPMAVDHASLPPSAGSAA